MIGTFFLNAFYGLLSILFSLFPTSSGLPGGFANAISSTVNFINAYSILVDVDTLFTVIIYTVAFELGIIGYKVVLWVIHIIRG